MNTIERINRALEDWVESLRGGSHVSRQHSGGLQPKDVLRQILSALEENRVEGLDHKQYVPNAYAIELSLEDPEEKARLLPFLGKEEIADAIERYCHQHQYILRGPLEIALLEAARPAVADPDAPSAPLKASEKILVHCRYDIPQATGAISDSNRPDRVFSPQPELTGGSAAAREERSLATPRPARD